MLIASCSVTIPTNDQVSVYLGSAFAAVFDHIKAEGAKDSGPCLAVWHQPAEIHANEVAEAAVPIDRSIAGAERVKVYKLPSVQVVSVVHHGEFDNFRQEHTALLQWIEANDYRIIGPYREIYINHASGNMADAATEIQYPVEQG